jgi:lipopolysaccharide/colanic/teichoic acid biosynthesis glycosyltransferase
MAVIAVTIAATSPGPILFRQKRIGLHGKDFEFLKFRTMTCLRGSEDGMFTPGDQCRITTVGRVLRRSKLDELPQFFNVLRGDLSLVGPRPEVRQWVDAYPERWAVIHQVQPGIFDPATIVFRNEEELLARAPEPVQEYLTVILPKKLTLNEHYVRHRCVVADIGILARGLLALFS